MTRETHDADRTLDAVVVEVDIAAPREAVFDHLVDPQKVLRWLGIDGDLEVRPGGRFHIRITPDDVARGEYVDVRPPESVVFTWGWDGSDDVPPGSSTVRIELSATEFGTRVRLVHSGLPDDTRDDHGAGWVYFTGRLGLAAAGTDPGPVDLTPTATRSPTGETS